MSNILSTRSERREARLYASAEKGQMKCSDFSLYSSEAKLLKKQGFEVVRLGKDLTLSLPSTISWENAFKDGIPVLVSEYQNGIIDTFPESKIQNWAQRLYTIAARTQNDQRKSRLYALAEKGEMKCTDLSLNNNEAKDLQKCGFEVVRLGEDSQESLSATISWEKPFPDGMPVLVFDYKNGLIDDFPSYVIENWAQELYTIAARASYVEECRKNAPHSKFAKNPDLK